jgi:hypothetical protein
VDRLQRALNHRATVAGVLETLMWLAVPYLAIGVIVTFLHADYVSMLATQFERLMPAGADLAAFGQITLMWPGLVLAPHLCMV